MPRFSSALRAALSDQSSGQACWARAAANHLVRPAARWAASARQGRARRGAPQKTAGCAERWREAGTAALRAPAGGGGKRALFPIVRRRAAAAGLSASPPPTGRRRGRARGIPDQYRSRPQQASRSATARSGPCARDHRSHAGSPASGLGGSIQPARAADNNQPSPLFSPSVTRTQTSAGRLSPEKGLSPGTGYEPVSYRLARGSSTAKRRERRSALLFCAHI